MQNSLFRLPLIRFFNDNEILLKLKNIIKCLSLYESLGNIQIIYNPINHIGHIRKLIALLLKKHPFVTMMGFWINCLLF
jgi:hypothetical protein